MSALAHALPRSADRAVQAASEDSRTRKFADHRLQDENLGLRQQLTAARAALIAFSVDGHQACRGRPSEPHLQALFRALWPDGMTAEDRRAGADATLGLGVRL